MYRHDQESAVVSAPAGAGFTESLDQRPVRLVLAASTGRELDLHPLAFAADGSAVQASFAPDRPFRTHF